MHVRIDARLIGPCEQQLPNEGWGLPCVETHEGRSTPMPQRRRPTDLRGGGVR
jgi:hypothetical protein